MQNFDRHLQNYDGKIVIGTCKIMMGKNVIGTYKIMMDKNVIGTYKIMNYDGHLQDAGNAQICAGYLVKSKNKLNYITVDS
jgi:hypothetical protein